MPVKNKFYPGMRRIAFCVAAFLAFGSIKAQNSASPAKAQDISKVISFKETDHDLGKIPYGKPVEFDVYMTNISQDSVKIENVQASCGCTTPKWNPGPYAAGQEFKITLGFNGYTDGHFEKYVSVFFSGGVARQLKFHGDTFKEQVQNTPNKTK